MRKINFNILNDPKEMVNEDSIQEQENESENQRAILEDSQIAQTELPKILLRVASAFRTSLKKLKQDEYGDLILKPKDGNDENSQKVL